MFITRPLKGVSVAPSLGNSEQSCSEHPCAGCCVDISVQLHWVNTTDRGHWVEWQVCSHCAPGRSPSFPPAAAAGGSVSRTRLWGLWLPETPRPFTGGLAQTSSLQGPPSDVFQKQCSLSFRQRGGCDRSPHPQRGCHVDLPCCTPVAVCAFERRHVSRALPGRRVPAP